MARKKPRISQEGKQEYGTARTVEKEPLPSSARTVFTETDTEGSEAAVQMQMSGAPREPMRHATPAGEKHRFIKNDQYFTISIYAFIVVLCCALGIKSIVAFDQTKQFFTGLFRALGPFLIALLIAYILNPFVTKVNGLLRKAWKNRHEKLCLGLSMLIVYLIGLGMIITILVYVLPELVRNIADLIRGIPDTYDGLKEWLTSLQTQFPMVDFSAIINMLNDTQNDLTTGLKDIAGSIIPVLYTASVSVVQWFTNFLIALIVSVYMLYGKASLKRLIRIIAYSFIPESSIPMVKEIATECNHIFSQYLVSKMIDSFIIGVLCAILMTIFRLPYILLISVIVGVTNMIPYFGPFIGAVPGIVIIFCVSPVKSVVFALMILGLQQFDGLILGPKLLGDSTGMKPLWIIFAITIGGKFFGVIGMFLGVPVVAALSYLAGLYMDHRLRQKNMRLDDFSDE